MPVPAELAICVDASKWQPEVDYATWKAGGVEAIIAKATQGSTGKDRLLSGHYLGARSMGMRFGVYHWADPTISDKAQLDNFLKTTEKIEYNFACVDIEQYWVDWNEYLNGHITKFISPNRISDNGEYLVEEIYRATGKSVMPYTRAWFIKEFSMPMLEWVCTWPVWWAQYVYDRADVILNWNQLHKTWLPKTANPAFPSGWTGLTDWTCWQWSGDKFILPGCSTCLDMNYIQRDFLNQFDSPLPPAAVTQTTVDTATLNIRTLPGGRIIGTTKLGNVLDVEQTVTDPEGKTWYKVAAYVAGWLTKPKV